MNPFKSGLIKNTLSSDGLTSILMKTVPKLDRSLMKISKGWLNCGFQAVALIETTGAKTGLKREFVTLCMPDDEQLYLVGSNWGRNTPPGWYFNLTAKPQAIVTFRGFKGPVSVTEVIGEQRQQLWPRLVEYNPQYQNYQQSCKRVFPVLQLTRTATDTSV